MEYTLSRVCPRTLYGVARVLQLGGSGGARKTKKEKNTGSLVEQHLA